MASSSSLLHFSLCPKTHFDTSINTRLMNNTHSKYSFPHIFNLRMASSSSLLHFSAERLILINNALQRLCDSSMPNDREIRNSIVNLIKQILYGRFGREIRLIVYGSFAMGLELQDSDINVTVIADTDSSYEKDNVFKEIIYALSDAVEFYILKKQEGPHHMVVLKHKQSGIAVDVTLNNIVTSYIAKFVKDSLSAHPLVRTLTLIVKNWLKAQGVTKRTLPSVSSALMSISYLQEGFVESDGTEAFEVALQIYKDDIEQSKAEKAFDNLSIGQLVYDFFVHYSRKHDFNEDVISVLGGKLLKKDIYTRGNHHFVILDPFTWNDKGKNVSYEDSIKLQNYFAKAALILRSRDIFSFDKPYDDLNVPGRRFIKSIPRHELLIRNQSIDGEVAVVMMQEGRAEIFIIGTAATVTCCRTEASIPRKDGPDLSYYEGALSNFFERVAQDCLKHIDFKKVRCAIIGSPGFFKDQFYRYLMEAENHEFRAITANESRIFLVNTTSGYKHSLKEVLLAPDVLNIIKDIRPVHEVQAFEAFFTMLRKDQNCICYGARHVKVAFERMAVHTLFITDKLFSSDNKTYLTLIESIKTSGGAAHILSTMHVSGERLADMNGIAAILRFPLPELDDMEM